MVKHRYRQAGLPLGESTVPVETFGPEQPGPTLEAKEQGVLPVIPLGPLFDQMTKGKKG